MNKLIHKYGCCCVCVSHSEVVESENILFLFEDGESDSSQDAH